MKTAPTLQELKGLYERVLDAKAAVHKLERAVSEMVERMSLPANVLYAGEAAPITRCCFTCKYKDDVGFREPCASCRVLSSETTPYPRWAPEEPEPEETEGAK